MGASCQISSAADQAAYTSPDKEVTFLGGVGYTWLKADEIVYDRDGNRVSHLFWDSQAPVLTGAMRAEFATDWKIMANVTTAFAGSSEMKDYDWFGQYLRSYDFDDWTHRSISGTKLDRYWNVDIAVGRNFTVTEDAVVNLHGGFKYTNTKWTAYGGSFVYSRTGFRADVGEFPADLRGISYEQRLPTVFLGAEATAKMGRLTFSALLRGGVTVNASDTDHHWRRGLLFKETFGPTPFMSAGAELDYAMTEKLSFVMAVAFDKYFSTKGDSTVYSIESGKEVAPTSENGAGLALQALTLSAGVKLAF